MEGWSNETSKALLGVPWNHHPTPHSEAAPNLLTKLKLTSNLATSSLSLLFLTTDLSGAYIEVLNKRQLTRRFREAFTESQDTETQSQVDGFDELESDAFLEAKARELVEAVEGGIATLTFEQASYENTVSIKLQNYTFKLLCDSLGSNTGACLSTHLITPLLGLSSALLSLVKDTALKDGSLEKAIDVSASGERAKEGRACKIFFEVGKPAFGRWMQRFDNVKEKHILPLKPLPPTTSQSRYLSTAPIPVTRESSSERSPVRSTRTQTSSVLPSDSTKAAASSPAPKRLIAQQMLNHRNPPSGGQRIQWDDSQDSRGASSPPTTKGKGRLYNEDLEAMDIEAAGEESDELSFPPLCQPPSSNKRHASRSPTMTLEVDLPPEEEPEDPATEEDDDGDTDPSQVKAFPATGYASQRLASQSQSRYSSPESSRPSTAAPVPTPEPTSSVGNVEEDKKAKKEKEKREEMAVRARNLEAARKAAQLKAAQAAAGGAKPKKKKKL